MLNVEIKKMPILNVYSVHDAAAQSYISLYYMPTDQMMIRAMAAAVNDDNHEWSRAPSDYRLYKLGTWDQENGKLNPETAPILIAGGAELRGMVPGTQDTQGETASRQEVGNTARTGTEPTASVEVTASVETENQFTREGI
jgi:hypothetical protein